MEGKLIIVNTAVEAVEAKSPKSAYFAGGTEIERLGSFVHADRLILLKKVEGLDVIKKEDGALKIGAMCSFEKAFEDADVPSYLKTALLFMASRTKRNMATVGGNIAIARDDSYLWPTLLAAGAKMELLCGNGKSKTVDASEYPAHKTDYADALITALILPAGDEKVLSERYANTAESHAALTVSVGRRGDKYIAASAIKNAGVFIFDELSERLSTEKNLPENEIMSYFDSWKGADISDDMFGSEAYKRYILGVSTAGMVKRLQEVR